LERSEFRTRLDLIDVLLQEQGWPVSDRSRVWTEVDTRQSDFPAKQFRTVSDTLKNDMESAYADYLLLDHFGAPLAIIEAESGKEIATLCGGLMQRAFGGELIAQNTI